MPKFGSKADDQCDDPMDNQEEATRAAILDKAMKGRQPTDLMLRCMFRHKSSKFWSAD
jgi:magnesium transporter